MKIKTFRRSVQGVTFTLFIILFLFTVYPFARIVPVKTFLQLDPLVALVSMIGSRAIIVPMLLAVLLFILTLIFGRFFCGYICPLGTLIDINNFIFFRKLKKKESKDPKPNRNIKYFILIGVIAASLLGADLLHFFSPMSIAPRTFTLILFPPVIWFLNFVIDLIRPLALNMGFDGLLQFSFHRPYFENSIPTLIIIVIILVANYWRKRFWCRYLCPTGALLSLVSRFGIFKRKVTDKCSSCFRCMSACDMRAIDEEGKNTILSECTLCGNCVEACKQKENSIGITSFGTGKNNSALLVDRRKFIYSAVTGIAAAATIKGGIHNENNIKGRFVRPPGSIPEADFLARCIRCGECMKVCKTNGLQPANLESGFDALWTPRLKPRVGACEDKCNMCGQVCPTQAIRKLPLEEKLYAKIGTAVIDRRRCIAWEQNKLCLICDEICPYDAIEFRITETFTGPFKRPFVLEDKCVGCGWCEHKCPINGRAAIEVYCIGEERFLKGSYITEQKKKMREVKETHESDYGVDDLGSGGEDLVKPPTKTPDDAGKKETEDEPLPGGFILDE